MLSGSGVNLHQFVPLPEPDDGRPVVMMPARLIQEKGVHFFVEAARSLRRQGTAVRFVLVGSPDVSRQDSITEAALRQWVEEGVIEWWGWRDDMHQVYPQAHIVCLPTYYGEGVPRTLIEAAACGRPIVATDIPGCRKVVRHGENGLLVPVRDSAALADALAALLGDAARRRRMGARSRQIAEEQFSARQNVAQYFAIYGIGA
jgi:glycosyltransferase involved in cell wall biosynthesis